MEDLITIWTPVIVSKLLNHHKTREQVVYYLDRPYQRLEDVKIKIKKAEAGIHSKEVEVIVKMEFLCLVQDVHGLHLVNRQEKAVNRIPINEFSKPFTRDQKPGFAVNLTQLKWEGELNGQELKITYGFEYMVLVLQDQVVQVSAAGSTEPWAEGRQEIPFINEDEMVSIREKNEELQRKIFYYERDIDSLKKGIYKTEKRNATLNREVIHYQQLVEQLQIALQDKENQLIHSRRENFSYWHNPPMKETSPLAARLKRMFITAL